MLECRFNKTTHHIIISGTSPSSCSILLCSAAARSLKSEGAGKGKGGEMEEREGGELFFLQTLVTRSKRLAGGWAVRAPFPSGLALHPELRFAWELGWPP